MATWCGMPDSLRSYLSERLRASLRDSLRRDPSALSIENALDELERSCASVYTFECELKRCIHSRGTRLCRRCARVSQSALAVERGDAASAIDASVSENHFIRRQIIGGYHAALKDEIPANAPLESQLHAWKRTAGSGAADDRMAEYAEQAKTVGSHRWCQAANEWCIDYTMQCCVEFGNAPRVLDVGSSYDACGELRQRGFHVDAVDLVPADPRVYSCDFLSIDIFSREEGSSRVRKRSDVGHYGETDEREWSYAIDSFPCALYDVVIMTLVVTFLPSEELRGQMVGNARALLKRNGLLLLVDSASINKDRRGSGRATRALSKWRASLEQASLKFEKHERLQGVHALAFRATCDGTPEHAFAVGVLPIAADGDSHAT